MILGEGAVYYEGATIRLPEYECPKGHRLPFCFSISQTNFSVPAPGERDVSTGKCCTRCFFEWLQENFPTKEVPRP